MVALFFPFLPGGRIHGRRSNETFIFLASEATYKKTHCKLDRRYIIYISFVKFTLEQPTLYSTYTMLNHQYVSTIATSLVDWHTLILHLYTLEYTACIRYLTHRAIGHENLVPAVPQY